jgi:hypothetical protein
MGSMGDQYKISLKNYKAFRKKQNELSTFPRCSSDSIEVDVMNSLDPDKSLKAEIVEIGRYGRQGFSYVIKKIRCPLCNDMLEIDKQWLGFICANHDDRRIWEIIEIYEKDGTRFR